MQFLKTLFWVALAVVLVLFASVNWTPVTVALWGGLEADVKLPILVLGAFLVGFLPMLILHRAKMWTIRRRLEGFERQAAALHAPSAAEPAASPPLAPETAPVP
jgi:putative membrane protein